MSRGVGGGPGPALIGLMRAPRHSDKAPFVRAAYGGPAHAQFVLHPLTRPALLAAALLTTWLSARTAAARVLDRTSTADLAVPLPLLLVRAVLPPRPRPRLPLRRAARLPSCRVEGAGGLERRQEPRDSSGRAHATRQVNALGLILMALFYHGWCLSEASKTVASYRNAAVAAVKRDAARTCARSTAALP